MSFSAVSPAFAESEYRSPGRDDDRGNAVGMVSICAAGPDCGLFTGAVHEIFRFAWRCRISGRFSSFSVEYDVSRNTRQSIYDDPETSADELAEDQSQEEGQHLAIDVYTAVLEDESLEHPGQENGEPRGEERGGRTHGKPDEMEGPPDELLPQEHQRPHDGGAQSEEEPPSGWFGRG